MGPTSRSVSDILVRGWPVRGNLDSAVKLADEYKCQGRLEADLMPSEPGRPETSGRVINLASCRLPPRFVSPRRLRGCGRWRGVDKSMLGFHCRSNRIFRCGCRVFVAEALVCGIDLDGKGVSRKRIVGLRIDLFSSSSFSSLGNKRNRETEILYDFIREKIFYFNRYRT